MADMNAAGEPNKAGSEGASGESQEGAPILPVILARAKSHLEGLAGDLEFKPLDDALEVTLPVDRLLSLSSAIRNDLGYRMLMSITAVDWKDNFELVYHLYRLDSAFPIVLRCRLPHDERPEAPSVVSVWAGADFQEREIYDLMGIVFQGHPDLRRILLADDFPGHPLRKDWQPDPDYVLMPHLRIPGYPGARRGEASTGRFLDE